MPCPRLKMWPARPPARFSTSLTPASTAGQGASTSAGSRFPWIATSGPRRSQALSSGRRQSTLTAAHPVPEFGLAVHQRLGPWKLSRGSAFDQVAGQCERGSGKTEQRGPLAEGDL